jgi:ABC-type uncharacterized transport system involved in gliding motility auxiliary subunit
MADRSGADAGGNRRTFGGLGLLALAVVFLVGVAAINLGFRGLRLDLTENRLYTLSPGTVAVLESIPEPVNLYLFFSDRATADNPYLRSYAGRVREMLTDFAERSGGKLRLSVVDPLPFSEDEDRATQFGLRPINLSGSPDPIYLGVAGTNSVGDDEIIPFLDPAKEQFLEYDLARLVYTLATPEKPVVALLPGLPMMAGFDPMTQQVRQAWAVAEQMRQFFQLKVLDPAVTRIADDVKVLVVVHPKELPPTALYAIDQFVMRGGRAVFFVDPFSEIDQDSPMAAAEPGGRASSLETLLGAWGVQVDGDTIVGDDRYALTVAMNDNRPVRHIGIVGVDAGGLEADDVISGGLSLVNFAFAGHIEALPPEEGRPDATIQPLIRSSTSAALIPVDRLAFMPDPELLREDFTPRGERYTLAARLTGKVRSAYAGGPPEGAEAPAGGHLAEAREPINVVLVADTDLLADRLWIQTQDFFGQRLASAFANNGDFVMNAVDNLLGSGDLISIRSRATFTRPFTRVQDLRREAEARFRLTEERLQQELEATEARLEQLQAARQDQGSTLLLSPEQQAEIERFQNRRLEIRKELRQVQRGLDENIERLGNTLKIINIGAMPLLISLVSLALLVFRRRRRAAAAEARA